VRLEEIEEARGRLSGQFATTPLLSAPRLSDEIGCEVLLKAENLQQTGSFKVRGAYNRISRLGGAEECPGVICASTGNHALGVALAARVAGLTATIIMPVATPVVNVARTRSYGAHVLLWGEEYEEAYQRALDVGRERGYAFVHAFEDPEVISGQGTVGLELLDQAPDLGAVIVPIGGGGLISGIATAIKEKSPGTAVYGVQASGAAPAAASLEAGHPVTLERADTIADAIRVKTASEVTFPIMKRYLNGVVTVTEEEISDAVVKLLEEAKMVVEGAGAVPLAALLAGKVPRVHGKVALVLAGGNMDLNLLARVIEQGLARANRYLVVRTEVPDLPGRLHKLLSHFASKRVNVLDVELHRAGWRIPLDRVEIQLLLETRNAAHAEEILRDLKRVGYRAERDETLGAAENEEPAGGGAGGRQPKRTA
jgi:threonine dehydratase